MKHGWKSIIAITLMVMTVAACSKKGGNASGGTTATPPAADPAPAAPAAPAPEIPETSNQVGDIKAGAWTGDLTVVNVEAYKKYLKKITLCKKSWCTSAAGGTLRVNFNVFNNHVPTNHTSMVFKSKVLCADGKVRATEIVKINGRWATGNTDGNGFQWTYFLQGPYANLNQFDPDNAPVILGSYDDEDFVAKDAHKLQFVAVYTDATRTNITGRVYYKGVKIAEGPLNFANFDFDYFDGFYSEDDLDADNYVYVWVGKGRNKRRVRQLRLDHDDSRNERFYNNSFNFSGFVNSDNFGAFLNLHVNN